MLVLDKYIDDRFTILSGTLLSLKGKSETLTIPSQVNGHVINRIGSGCSIDKNTRSIVVEEGIKQIGDKAFSNCNSARKLYLPESLESCGYTMLSTYSYSDTDFVVYLKRSLSEEEYGTIKKNSIELFDGSILLGSEHRHMPVFSEIYKGFCNTRVPVRIEKEMHGLYRLRVRNAMPDQMNFDGLRGGIKWNSLTTLPVFRTDLARQMLRETPVRVSDAKSEINHDVNLQYGRKNIINEVILTRYREKEVEKKDGRYHITFHIRFGKVFFPSLCMVKYFGNVFYIYREYYLNGDIHIPFLIEDYTDKVYLPDGTCVAEAMAKEVVGKFRLLSMLT